MHQLRRRTIGPVVLLAATLLIFGGVRTTDALAATGDAGWTTSGCLTPYSNCLFNDGVNGDFDFYNQSNNQWARFAGPEINPETGTGAPTIDVSPLTGEGTAAQITSVGGGVAGCNNGQCTPAIFGGIETGCWQNACVGSTLPIADSSLGSQGITVTYDNDASGSSPPSHGTFDDQLNLWFMPPGDQHGSQGMQGIGLNMIISNGGIVNGKRDVNEAGACPTQGADSQYPFYKTGVSIEGSTWIVCATHAEGAGDPVFLNFVKQSNGEYQNIKFADFAAMASSYGFLPSGWYLSCVATFHETWTGVTANELTIQDVSFTS